MSYKIIKYFILMYVWYIYLILYMFVREGLGKFFWCLRNVLKIWSLIMIVIEYEKYYE